MKSSPLRWTVGLGLVFVGLGLLAGGIYIGESDDAPGAALLGMVLLIGAMTLAWRIVRRRT